MLTVFHRNELLALTALEPHSTVIDSLPDPVPSATAYTILRALRRSDIAQMHVERVVES